MAKISAFGVKTGDFTLFKKFEPFFCEPARKVGIFRWTNNGNLFSVETKTSMTNNFRIFEESVVRRNTNM